MSKIIINKKYIKKLMKRKHIKNQKSLASKMNINDKIEVISH